ncbi:MAG: ATP-dependent DNA helicase [Candidatus Thermoplasmatota archaeon]|jgi:DNA excision repair protein ERCC-2|nr:ATP-dependent DNA helicase [Candidatus Thermoplasmatota archaeon]MCL5963079.1 ATP-dependent DNA helicase [Candidatus Thermoplasmatota archaeon]
MISMDFRLFPYNAHPYQIKVMDNLYYNIEHRITTLLNAPTGSGKTIMSLTPALDFAFRENKKILYLVRTKTQELQVLKELKEIHKIRPVTGIGIQGRRGRCPLLDKKSEFKYGGFDELSKICSDRKRKSLSKASTKLGSFVFDEWNNLMEVKEYSAIDDECKYFEKTIEEGHRYIEDFTTTIWMPDEFNNISEKAGICPYEMSKKLIEYSTVVIAPYIFYFNSAIRNNLLNWMNISENDLMVIIDEAHNIPQYLRDLSSVSLTPGIIDYAIKEHVHYGMMYSKREDILFVNELLNGVKKFIINEASKLDSSDDRLFSEDEFYEYLMYYTRHRIRDIKNMILKMIEAGDYIKEDKRREKKLPRSYLYKAAVFLEMLNNVDSTYIKIINKYPQSVEMYNMEPAKLAEPLKSTFWNMHMSGTLIPLDQYRDVLELGTDSDMIVASSIYPIENRKIIYSDRVTTQYDIINKDTEMFNHIHEEIIKILKKVVKNTIIFYPSYSMLLKGEVYIKKWIKDRPIFSEKKDTETTTIFEYLDSFKQSIKSGGILLSVAGGRVAEGIDLPGEQLEVVIVVGIPFPRPTTKNKMLERYYNVKYDNNGWNYVYRDPTTRKVMQCIGRLIRSVNDRGVIVILDKRATMLKKYLNDLSPSTEPANDILKFFNIYVAASTDPYQHSL